MTDAQNEALCLLDLVDTICLKLKIQYTLGNRSLINYEYRQGEEYFNPNSITICLMYKEYRRVLEYFNEHREEYNIEIMNYHNSFY